MFRFCFSANKLAFWCLSGFEGRTAANTTAPLISWLTLLFVLSLKAPDMFNVQSATCLFFYSAAACLN